MKYIFNYLPKKKSLLIIKSNKRIQNRLNLDINAYKKFSGEFSSVEIEIIPWMNEYSDFIKISNGFEYCHIYFDNSKKEVATKYLDSIVKAHKIKIILEHQIKSFEKLFSRCNCIRAINFKKFCRNEINMSKMFYKCKCLKKIANWGERTVAVSDDIKTYLIENYGVPAEQISVTINGIDGEKFSPDVSGERVLREFGLDGARPVISYVSRMDESRALVLLDFGGRIDFAWDVEFTREYVGDTPTEMFKHFFQSLCSASKCNLRIEAKGENNHHIAEAVFKAYARALKMAIKRDVFSYVLPSSKGLL